MSWVKMRPDKAEPGTVAGNPSARLIIALVAR